LSHGREAASRQSRQYTAIQETYLPVPSCPRTFVPPTHQQPDQYPNPKRHIISKIYKSYSLPISFVDYQADEADAPSHNNTSDPILMDGQRLIHAVREGKTF
jgi:hypothetical protein